LPARFFDAEVGTQHSSLLFRRVGDPCQFIICRVSLSTNGAYRIAKLQALSGEDLTIFTDVERLLIELADATAATPAKASSGLYDRLRKQFSEEKLLQLGAHIGFEHYRARLNRVFDVGSDNFYAAGDQVERIVS
jgi:hypothetical protein